VAVAATVPIDATTWDLLQKLTGSDDPVDEIRVHVGAILRFPSGLRYELGRVTGVENPTT